MLFNWGYLVFGKFRNSGFLVFEIISRNFFSEGIFWVVFGFDIVELF